MKPSSQELHNVSEDDLATLGEVKKAIEALTNADYAKLMLIARYFCKARIADPSIESDDLLQEAIVRTLTGTRKWKKGISLLKHLDRTMESISSYYIEKQSKSPRIDSLSDNNEQLQAPIPAPSVSIEVTDKIESVLRLFKNDEIALKYLQLKGEGLQPSDIQSKLNINNTQYDTITRRIRRRITKYLAKGDHDEIQ